MKILNKQYELNDKYKLKLTDMNKKEFLIQKTRDVTEIFEKHGSYYPTFAILYEDGTTDSFATLFNGLESKDAFDSMMHEVCANPKVIASVYTAEVWISKSAWHP